MANRIQLRRDTTANWANVNPILSDGEMGYDINTNEIRIGDGSTDWTGLSGNVIGGGGGANLGNIITPISDSDITSSRTNNFVNLGADDGYSMRFGTYSEDTVQLITDFSGNNHVWEFRANGNVILPLGSTIGETANTTVISPPGALAGQSLVIRPTLPGQFDITTDHPDGFVPGESITVTVTTTFGNGTGTVEYTFTDATSEQLGRALTGTLTFSNESAQSVTWTVPAESNMTTFTFTVTGGSGFDSGVTPGNFITVTLDGSSGEGGHVHLLSGNIATVDLYLGDDNQYVKIEKNAGNVVIGTNTNTNHWRFGTDGTLTLPTMGGDEGAEIAFGKAANSGLSGNTVVIDQFVNRFRFFEGGGSNRGAYIDLGQAAPSVGTLLNNRVSGFVNAGANVIMDSLKATVTTSDQRGLSLAATVGSFEANVAGTYANVGGTGGSRASVSITTSPSASLFGWNFDIAGDMATYIITDSTNSRAYRVTMQIGDGYNNNMVSIERLV
jgi:hypothetical protein